MEITQTTDMFLLEQCARLMNASEPFVTLGFDYERCLRGMQGGLREIYIVRKEGLFAGFVVLNLDGPLRGYIQTLCVEPGFRNKGIGTALLSFSEERIARVSPHTFICVSSFNHGAQALYYRMGFEKIAELKDHITKGYDEYLLRKSKGPIFGYVPAEQP